MRTARRIAAPQRTLNLIDRSWLLVDRPRTPVQVGCLAQLSVPAGAPVDFVARMVERLRQATEFVTPFDLRLRTGPRQLLPQWEQLPAGSVDLGHHVRHAEVPRPGSERELGAVVSQLHSQPLDKTRPLWECHVIEGLDGGRFALYFKMHHVALDGVALMRRMQRMFDTDPATDALWPVWAAPSQGGRSPRAGRRASRSFPVRAVAGLRSARSVAATVTGLELQRRQRRHPGPYGATPFGAERSVLNDRVTDRRRVATQSLELGFVKRVADAVGVTVNDLFLAICSAALRRYLVEIGKLPESDLTAGTPVDLRDRGDASTGNAFSMMLINLHTLVADPVARVQAVRASAELAKRTLQELPAVVRDNYGVLLLAPYMAQLALGLAGRVRPPFNVITSSIRGPDEPQYLGGARLEACFPLSLVVDGQGLSITVLSAGGRFDVGVVGCTENLPHLHHIARYTAAALHELATLYGVAAP